MRSPALRFVANFVVVFATCALPALAAQVLPSRDVDALMWSSRDVIVAEIIAHQLDPANQKKIRLTTVVVTKVVKGALTAGQEVVFSNIGNFNLPSDLLIDRRQGTAVPPRSTVVVFTRAQTGKPRPAEVLDNGLWFVHGELVYESMQYWPRTKSNIPAMSPRPGYTARSRLIDPQYTPLQEADLLKTLEASQSRIAAYHELLDGPADAANVERYFELYQSRKRADPFREDPIANAAGSQFARAAPIDRVLELLLLEPSGVRSVFSPFSVAFESLDAREHLLRQLEDPQASPSRLRALAEAVDVVDWRYARSDRDHPEAARAKVQERFFERCANVAVNRSDTEAAAVLIRLIDSAARSIRDANTHSSSLQADVEAARKIVISTEWKSAEARYRAAILARDTHPPVAPKTHSAIITVVRSLRVQGSPDGDVIYAAFDWNSARPAGSVQLRPALVVRSIDGKTTAEFSKPPPSSPIKHPHRADFQRHEPGGGKGVIEFAIDQSLPDGDYDVFLRFRDGEAIIADGVTARLTVRR